MFKLVTLGCLSICALISSAAAEPVISGSWAKHFRKADIDRIKHVCRERTSQTPWHIMVYKTYLGYKEREDGPLYFILSASAYLPPSKTGRRYEVGDCLDFDRGEKQKPEKWTDSAIKGRWLRIKPPSDLKILTTPWYRDPFTIAARVRPRDVVEIVDLAYREALRESNQDVHVPSREDVAQPIIRIGKFEKSESEQLMMEVGIAGHGGWSFYVFEKKNGRWKVLSAGVGTAGLLERYHRLTSRHAGGEDDRRRSRRKFQAPNPKLQGISKQQDCSRLTSRTPVWAAEAPNPKLQSPTKNYSCAPNGPPGLTIVPGRALELGT